jgi:predicted transposase YbfD/YdcC
MKPIRIKEENRAKIQAAIDAVQGLRIKKRLISADDVFFAESRISPRLNALLYAKDYTKEYLKAHCLR